MRTIEFNNTKAGNLYRSYMRRAENVTRILAQKDRNDILMELNSHIYEGVQRNLQDNELENLVDVLCKLGNPEEYLMPEVASRKLMQATHSFQPKHIAQALRLNIKNGFKYIVFTLLYLFLFVFIFLAIAKLIWYSNTGLFLLNGKFYALGFIKNTQGANEVLGFWFFPICLAVGALFYTLITLLLRKTR